MNPVLIATLRGAATVIATGVVTGGTLYEQGSNLRTAITAAIVAAAASVLAQLVPKGAAAAIAENRPKA